MSLTYDVLKDDVRAGRPIDFGFVTYVPERTCRNLLSGQYDGATFKCSECGYVCEVAITDEPEPYSWLTEWYCALPNYCPNCGAKVVGDDADR